MGTHKPGELFFKINVGTDQGMIYGDDGKTIAVIYNNKDGFGELFASAPELLEALKQTEKVFNVEEIDPMQAFIMIEKIRGIIAKAEGRA